MSGIGRADGRQLNRISVQANSDALVVTLSKSGVRPQHGPGGMGAPCGQVRG
jgi:hypothetical protein